MSRDRLVRVALLAVAAVSVHAQSPPATRSPEPAQEFEVASVRANRSNDGAVRIGAGAGQYRATNVPLRLLIQNAFRVQPSQLIDAPDWTGSERFDIVAKLPENFQFVPGALQALQRALLAERFKLVTHRETRELPVYALVLARPGGGVPAGLQPASPECDPGRLGPPGPPGPAAPPGQQPKCALGLGSTSLSAGAATMDLLAQALAPLTGRVVQNKTGLTDQYRFDLKFTPDRLPQSPAGGPAPPEAPAFDPNAPSIFTALQEQLGLKLEPARSAVDVIVVDSVERPTEN